MLAMNDRLTGKLSRIRSGDYTPDDFIIADAKDAEMGGGNGALGVVAPDGKAMLPVTAGRYRQAMRTMMESGYVDIMLTSMSSAEALAEANAFEGSDVTQAIRLNDATDIWGFRGPRTGRSRPSRSGQQGLITPGALLPWASMR